MRNSSKQGFATFGEPDLMIPKMFVLRKWKTPIDGIIWVPNAFGHKAINLWQRTFPYERLRDVAGT